MPALVLDASAALRLVLDPAGHAAIADALTSAEVVHAPSLFVVETGNALWKCVRANQITERAAVRLHRDVTDLVDQWMDDALLFPEALLMAIELDHPVYDALYLVTARRSGSLLATCDRKLAGLATRLAIPLVG